MPRRLDKDVIPERMYVVKDMIPPLESCHNL